MSEMVIKKFLQDFCDSDEGIHFAMVVSVDGLMICHHGDVADTDLFAALFLELKIVCEKIVGQLDRGSIEEIYIRSKSGGVTILPIFDRGYLACLSSATINAGKVQIRSWKYIKKIYDNL
ncbi:hypothetical protein Maes01_02058 [Microbulbifer aestuariivivens]|uniref:Roadblock/LAMTOR2 domain-containing protein n=1 Tax=Microbulbifer aestuariivivens TaxID=1908308 RepID=A0ABP9WT98_9GAMM